MKVLIAIALMTVSTAALAGNKMDKKLIGNQCAGPDWQLVMNAAESSIAAQSNPPQVIENLKRILAEENTTRCNLVMDSTAHIGIPTQEIRQFLIASSERSYHVEALVFIANDQITRVSITRVK